MHQIGALASLSPIARNQNECLGHDLTQCPALLRIGGSHHGSYIAVVAFLRHAARAPRSHLLSYDLVNGPEPFRHFSQAALSPRLSHQTVLQLPAAGIGSLHQYEYSLLLLRAYLQEGFHPVRAQIRVHGHEILIEAAAEAAANLYLPKMPHSIGLGGGTDIPTLDVPDNH